MVNQHKLFLSADIDTIEVEQEDISRGLIYEEIPIYNDITYIEMSIRDLSHIGSTYDDIVKFLTDNVKLFVPVTLFKLKDDDQVVDYYSYWIGRILEFRPVYNAIGQKIDVVGIRIGRYVKSKSRIRIHSLLYPSDGLTSLFHDKPVQCALPTYSRNVDCDIYTLDNTTPLQFCDHCMNFIRPISNNLLICQNCNRIDRTILTPGQLEPYLSTEEKQILDELESGYYINIDPDDFNPTTGKEEANISNYNKKHLLMINLLKNCGIFVKMAYVDASDHGVDVFIIAVTRSSDEDTDKYLQKICDKIDDVIDDPTKFIKAIGPILY